MLLQKLYLENFRCFKQQEIAIENITSFTGTNSAGKSTILQAIDHLLSFNTKFVESDYHKRQKDEIKIIGEFCLTTDKEKEYFLNYFGYPVSKVTLIKFSEYVDSKIKTQHAFEVNQFKNSLLNVSEVSGKTKSKYKKAVDDKVLPSYFIEDYTITGIKNAIYRYIQENNPEVAGVTLQLIEKSAIKTELSKIFPKTLYVPAFENIDKQTKFMKTNIFGNLLQLSFQQIEENNEFKQWRTRYQNLTNKIFTGRNRLNEISVLEENLSQYIREILPTNVILNFDLPKVEDFLFAAFELQLDDGVVTSVTKKGHGAQRAVIWSLLRNYLDVRKTNETNNTLFLVEEPELYLHPQAQRVMLRTLKSLAQTEQVIYSSHSPVFVDLENINAIRLVKKSKMATQIYGFSQLASDELNTIRMIKWMGDAHNELFFAKSVVLYEGATEKVILSKINEEPIIQVGDVNIDRKIKTPQTLDQLGCQLISTGGKFAMPFFAKLLTEAQIPFYIIYDNDSSSAMVHKETNQHIENRIKTAKAKGLSTSSTIYYPFLEIAWGLDKNEGRHVGDMYNLLAQKQNTWPQKMQESYNKLQQNIYRFAWCAFLELNFR